MWNVINASQSTSLAIMSMDIGDKFKADQYMD